MAKVFSWSGNGLANGTLTTASVGTGDNAFSFVQGAIQITSGRAVIPSNDQVWYMRTPTYDLTGHAVRTYFRIDSLPATGAPVVINAYNGAAQVWRVSLSSGGNLQLRDGGNVVVKTGPLITTGAWYRIEVVVRAGGDADFHVFDSNEASIFSFIGVAVNTGFTHAQFGKGSTVVHGAMYFDDMAVGDTAALLGPTGAVAALPTSFTWGGAGLANQDLTTLVKGTGDNAFYFVQGDIKVASEAMQITAAEGTWYASARIAATNKYAVRFYLQTGTRATRTVGMVAAYESSEPDALSPWQVTLNPDGIIQLRDAEKVSRVDGPILATNQKFHIEVVVDNGLAKMYIWNSSELQIFESASVAVGTTMGMIQFGKNLPDDYGPLIYDNMKIVSTAAIIGPATTVTPPAPSNKKIAIIGDSQMRQGGSGEALYRTELVMRGWSDDKIFFYAADGKRMISADVNGFSTMDNIAQARAAIGEPDVWVIALGMDGRADDDGTTISHAGIILTAIGAGKKVIWVNVGIANATDADVIRRNAVLLSAIYARGGASKVADWSGFIHDGRDETDIWNASGIALTQTGFRERIRFFGLAVGNAAHSQPTANGGPDVEVEPWSTATLVGTDSDSDGTVVTRDWRQISGPITTLVGTGKTRYYSVPPSLTGEILRFSYRVTDNHGQTSPDALVIHRILPVNERAVIGGVQVPIRILNSFDT